jgi:hypothetical protein
MRKRTFLLVLLLAVVVGTVALAQSRPADVESIYVRTRPIVKILTHQLGYKVFYVTQRGDVEAFYVPVEWFTRAGGKGTIAYGAGPQYPYFSVYWVDREFSHIKLFLQENIAARSWGELRASASEVAGEFDIEEPQIQWE